MVRSPHAHARIVSIDLSAAEKAPGVKAALAYKQPGAQVMYQGDPVAAVAADTEERALDAARLMRVRYERAAAPRQRRAGDGAGRAGGVPERQHAHGHGGRNRRSRRRLRQGRARRRSDLFDARDQPRLPRDARHGLRVGRRQADRVDLDAGGDSARAELRAGARHPAGQRPHHHAVHGRRLRQQVRARRAGHHLREAGAASPSCR